MSPTLPRFKPPPPANPANPLMEPAVSTISKISSPPDYDRETERALVNRAVDRLAAAHVPGGYDAEAFEDLNDAILRARASGDLMQVAMVCEGAAP